MGGHLHQQLVDVVVLQQEDVTVAVVAVFFLSTNAAVSFITLSTVGMGGDAAAHLLL